MPRKVTEIVWYSYRAVIDTLCNQSLDAYILAGPGTKALPARPPKIAQQRPGYRTRTNNVDTRVQGLCQTYSISLEKVRTARGRL
jgi:hypothetical protein